MRKFIALILFSISALVITSCGTPPEKAPIEDSEVSQDKDENVEKDEDTNKEETSDIEEQREIGIYPGMAVPDFTLMGREGEEITLSDYKGKITFLNFWATTCPYCIVEMPELEAFYNAHKEDGDVALLGINMTKTWEKVPKEVIIDWLDKEGLTFPVVFDVDGNQAEEWSARSLPATFIIDEEGVSRGAIVGSTDLKQLESELEAARNARDRK